ncbi:MAG: hypothetical protein QXY65_06770 [Candidatus Methanomethylicaceae archaeon]
MSEITRIRLIPKIKIEHSIDYKQERGYLYIYLKNGWWSIGYEFKDLTYFLGLGRRTLDIELDITSEALRIIWEEDKETGKFYKKEIPDWFIRDHGTEFKVITHPIEEIENAEELIEPKLTKSTKTIKRINVTLEYYEKNKILKIPFFNDEIRINIENENLEYIRNNKKIIKVFPLNKEIHFYGIKPKVWRYAYIPEKRGEELISTTD